MLRYDTTAEYVLNHVRAAHPDAETLRTSRLAALVSAAIDLTKAGDTLTVARLLVHIIANTMPAPLSYPAQTDTNDASRAATYVEKMCDRLKHIRDLEHDALECEYGADVVAAQARKARTQIGRLALAWLGEMIEAGQVHFDENHNLHSGIAMPVVQVAD